MKLSDGLPSEFDEQSFSNEQIAMDVIRNTFSVEEEDSWSDSLKTSNKKPYILKRRNQFLTVLELINTLICASVISVPNTFTTGGLAPAILSLLLSCTLNYVSSVILLNIQNELQVSSLVILTGKIMGKKFQYIVIIFCLIFWFTTSVTYLIIGADQIKNWLSIFHIPITGIWSWAALVFCYFILIPGFLTIPIHLTLLRSFEMITCLFVLFYAIAVTIKAFVTFDHEGPSKTAIGITFSMSCFTSFGVYNSSFCIPAILVSIISSYHPSIVKRKTVAGLSLFIVFLLTMIPGVFGYLVCGSSTQSDVLNSYPNNDSLMIVVRIAIFFVASFSFPITIHNMVGYLARLFYDQPDEANLTRKGRYILLCPMLFVNLVLAMFIKDINPLLGFGGSLGGSFVAFILPSICRLKMSGFHLGSIWSWLHLLFIGFGLIVGAVGTYTSISDAVSTYKSIP